MKILSDSGAPKWIIIGLGGKRRLRSVSGCRKAVVALGITGSDGGLFYDSHETPARVIALAGPGFNSELRMHCLIALRMLVHNDRAS